jgi:predicted ester cyclase
MMPHSGESVAYHFSCSVQNTALSNKVLQTYFQRQNKFNSERHIQALSKAITQRLIMNSNELKAYFSPFQNAMANFEASKVQEVLTELIAPDAVLRMCHPFGTMEGPNAYYENCLGALHTAMPDLERRDMIVLAGATGENQDWIGTMGNYIGTFTSPFLDIPPTGHLAHMRYHEFFKIENGKIVEMQTVWDIAELMMQANAWPMAPQLGAFLCTPGPMSGDGLMVSGDGQHTYEHIVDMLTDLCNHPDNPDPSVMQLEKYWHPRFNWYGPAGIGTCRGIAGFRNWHQIPFLHGMPDRKVDSKSDRSSDWDTDMSHWVAEGDYVCETGWPNMRLTLSGDGWMGIAPAGTEVELRSLDFWRLEDGLIRENWVLVDLLTLYQQIGVDVLARMREFNKARNIGTINLPDGLAVQR